MKTKKYYTPSIEEFHKGFEFEIFDTRIFPGEFNMEEAKKLPKESLMDSLKELSTIRKGEWFKCVWGDFWYSENDDRIIQRDSKLVCKMMGSLKVNVRVKHLDREDVEELGWKYSSLAEKYFLDGTLVDENNAGIWMNVREHGNLKIVDCRYEIHIMRFDGQIKNKSELKRLMGQLGITK